jgi:hypothetical protein
MFVHIYFVRSVGLFQEFKEDIRDRLHLEHTRSSVLVTNLRHFGK